jgi:hypothetical protein
MDTNALTSFKNAISQMPWVVIWAQQYRTAEEQKALVDKGVSWTMDSKHMKWLAVDIYADNKLSKPTAEQVATMNANGWYQPEETMNKWDYGHFEYKWVSWGNFSQDELNKFKYSEKLTPNAQNDYLKEQWLVDKYLQYNSTKQETSWGLLDWVSSIQDIIFPEKTTEFKTKSYNSLYKLRFYCQ